MSAFSFSIHVVEAFETDFIQPPFIKAVIEVLPCIYCKTSRIHVWLNNSAFHCILLTMRASFNKALFIVGSILCLNYLIDFFKT